MPATDAKEFETDVLVIGGGAAGVFAAVRAKGKGRRVLLVDKGGIGSSGCTPWVTEMAVFNEKWGDSREQWMDYCLTNGDHLLNRPWLERLLDDSYARYEDLASWGLPFTQTFWGRPHRAGFPSVPSKSLVIYHGIKNIPDVLRKKVRESGIETVERTMITDLLQQDGRVVGAAGFSLDRDRAVVIKSKVTVMCGGAASFKPSGFPVASLTGDGDAMAYRAGAGITGKEFVDVHWTYADHPAWGIFQTHKFLHHPWPMKLYPFSRMPVPLPRSLFKNVKGDTVGGAGLETGSNIIFEAHEGRAPVFMQSPVPGTKFIYHRELVGGASCGMAHHKAEGIWPIGTEGGTEVPGLFAAGDALGSMQCGADYRAVTGMSFSGSACQGARAGEAAARYAESTGEPHIDDARIAELTEAIFAPAKRKGGFTPGWVTQVLQNTMTPYFILYVKEQKRLKAALTIVEFMRDHLVPMLTAKDTHELRLAHETRNMVLNAEMKLRASLFRTESRGTHFREDFPARNDNDWFAFVKLQDVGGKMVLSKEPLPDEWKPDPSVPYEESYPLRFPGELEFLKGKRTII